MSRFASFFVMMCAALWTAAAGAQVGASSSRPVSLYAYATATGVENEQTYGKALGEGGGMFFQHSRWLGADFRGYIVNHREPVHTYLAEAGPRVQYPIWRLRPYAEGLGGLGHSGYRTRPNPLRSAYGAAWSIDFGADLRVTHRFEWRVADVNYTHIYAGPGVTPTILSTGIAFRVF